MTERAYRGVALAALVAIGLVTVAWWTLALYPVGAAAPEWLSRTRLACFGAAPGGLPNAGGWILLVGEPLGMVAILVAVWGDALRRDLRVLASGAWGRASLGSAALALGWGVWCAVTIVRQATTDAGAFALNEPGSSLTTALSVPPLALTDQDGRGFDLRTLEGTPVLMTFAFAHCETMCPTLVRDVLRLRRDVARTDVPLVIVTVDPWRDVPARLASIATAWQLADGDRVLSGAIADVNQVLDAWGIARRRDEATGDVVHALAVMLVHADGRTMTRVDGNVEGLRTILAGLQDRDGEDQRRLPCDPSTGCGGIPISARN